MVQPRLPRPMIYASKSTNAKGGNTLLLSAIMRPVPKPVRVLVVDDDEMSRELLSVLLESEGYIVDTADSGQSALAALHSSGSTPDLILSDMQMPGTTGSALATELRSVT